ncbi:MAG: hypothetical protein ACJA0J_000635, partial [Bdellovibrionota bacterium]
SGRKFEPLRASDGKTWEQNEKRPSTMKLMTF